MTYVNFRPYWNVPYAIALKEYVPILSRNPGYLGSHDMEDVITVADRRPELLAEWTPRRR